ncbi:hypothetical protein N0V82_007464 [Gnomoniopsis sp. IMI 355080]|nr:hypothetical protein N0V82_007464 [Gnomoniopsis sp. IMI 355080]
MRYEDWDVLLFPATQGRDARVPLKEFKVNCHVIPDTEFVQNRGTFGLPAMTCFVPSLDPGAQFHISIHCWGTPQVSQYALNYSKHPNLVKFEARILIDGRIVASTSFEPFGEWPHVVTTSCEMSKQGELETLKFPSFRRELLYQNHWSPGDDIGRIKIIISEGFPRDSPSNPIERVKNLVTFSFQHAPLSILETNGIAWPNQQMWRRFQNSPAVPVPTYYPEDGPDSHIHSPRRKSYGCRSTGGSGVAMTNMSNTLMPQVTSAFNHTSFPHFPAYEKTSGASSSSGYVDPFGDAAYQEWVASLGLAQQQQANTEPNTIWPGAVIQNSSKAASHDTNTSGTPDYIAFTMNHTVDSEQGGTSCVGMDEDGIMDSLKVPTNTPITATDGSSGATAQLGYDFPTPAISGELAHSLTHSLLNQPHPLHGISELTQPHQIPLPASEVRSRKENRLLNNASSTRSPSSNISPSVEAQIRKFSQTSNAFGIIGHDRGSSGTGPSYSRHTSAGEFGGNITNQAATPSPSYAGVAASASVPDSGSEKGTKRAKAIDEEYGLMRASPRERLATMVSSDDDGQSPSLAS